MKGLNVGVVGGIRLKQGRCFKGGGRIRKYLLSVVDERDTNEVMKGK
jgi:hypothetical protein